MREITGLVLVEKSYANDPEDARCFFCSSEISIPYYTDEEVSEYGRAYVHKVCWDMPEEMGHKQHRGHSLQLCDVRNRSAKICSVCDKLDPGGFSYRCSDCSDFSLDMVCALKSFPITHICHPKHTLIPIHDPLEEFLCAICKEVWEGISYKCLTCSFHVHQYCVTPKIIKQPFHRHGLKLIYSIPQNRSVRPIYCQICQEDMIEESLAYHCAQCRYFVHTYYCRSVVHSSHDHPLFLLSVEEKEADAYSAFAPKSCHGCGLKISVPYYCCLAIGCGSFCLHKSCAELPENVENRMHPGHALTLSQILKSDAEVCVCNACHAPWTGFKYYCAHASCRFNIDIVCAMMTIQSKHEFHQHPLISSHTKASFPCHACNKDTDGSAYRCTTCRFWVHQKCASVLVSKKYDLHPHKLKLTYSLSDSYPSRERFRCNACRKYMQPDCWAYHCAGCKYFTHVYYCKDPLGDIEGPGHEKALEAAAQLPVANEFVSLATLFFMDTNQEEEEDKKLLSQDGRGAKTRQMPFVDTTTYSGDKLLEAPCNNCDLCKCLLPKSPAEVQDPSGFNAHYSDTIGKNCLRFSISRDEEEDCLIMDVGSAVLPCFVKHEGHIHALATTFKFEPTWCNACEKDFEKEYGFSCRICEFTLDMYCAMLPGTVSHVYDKEHGFKLTYYSIEGVEEYICEICEGDITTMWFYHCAECDQSIHPKCIWKNYIRHHAYSIPPALTDME